MALFIRIPLPVQLKLVIKPTVAENTAIEAAKSFTLRLEGLRTGPSSVHSIGFGFRNDLIRKNATENFISLIVLNLSNEKLAILNRLQSLGALLFMANTLETDIAKITITEPNPLHNAFESVEVRILQESDGPYLWAKYETELIESKAQLKEKDAIINRKDATINDLQQQLKKQRQDGK